MRHRSWLRFETVLICCLLVLQMMAAFHVHDLSSHPAIGKGPHFVAVHDGGDGCSICWAQQNRHASTATPLLLEMAAATPQVAPIMPTLAPHHVAARGRPSRAPPAA
jgi:hypothetical protein